MPAKTKSVGKRRWLIVEMYTLVALVFCGVMLWSERFLPAETYYVWWLHNTLVGIGFILLVIQMFVIAIVPLVAIYAHITKKTSSTKIAVTTLILLTLVGTALILLAMAVSLYFLLFALFSIYESPPKDYDYVPQHCNVGGYYCSFESSFLASQGEGYVKSFRLHGLTMTYTGAPSAWTNQNTDSASGYASKNEDGLEQGTTPTVIPSPEPTPIPSDSEPVPDCKYPLVITKPGTAASASIDYPWKKAPALDVPDDPLPKEYNTNVMQAPDSTWVVVRQHYGEYLGIDRGDYWQVVNPAGGTGRLVSVDTDELGNPLLTRTEVTGWQSQWTTFDDGLNWFCYLPENLTDSKWAQPNQ